MNNLPTLSIIIPSRVDEFLQKTVDDVLAKAEGAVEVIVALSGYWPSPMIKTNPKVTVIHYGTIHDFTSGMRESINRGIAVARGKYIMKIDDHCMVEAGYDTKLIKDCEDNWVVIPRRYRLDADNWKVIEDGRPPVDYMFLDYPFKNPDEVSTLQGKEWKQRYEVRRDIVIDDTMTWQGSCWFMRKDFWDKIGPLDTKLYGTFVHEAQEIGNKVWLGGGRLVVNKKTWYAHFHKLRQSKGYGYSAEQSKVLEKEKEMGRLNCIDYWTNNKWPGRIHDFEWLIDKFWPVPNWPENWKKEVSGSNLKKVS